MQPSSESRQLFVGGLPKKASNQSLKEYFESFGPTIECRIMIDKFTQLSRGFAFVTFQTDDGFNRVVAHKDHKYLKTKISVKPAMTKLESVVANNEEKDRKIYIVGLPHKTRSEDVIKLFSRFGEIENIQLKAHRGFGFIEFKQRVSALDALECQEIFMLDGKPLEIRAMLPKNEILCMKVAKQAETSSVNNNQLPNLKTHESHLSYNSNFSKRSDISIEEPIIETRPRNQKTVMDVLSDPNNKPLAALLKNMTLENIETHKKSHFSDGASRGTPASKKGALKNSDIQSDKLERHLGYVLDDEADDDVDLLPQAKSKYFSDGFNSTQVSSFIHNQKDNLSDGHGKLKESIISFSGFRLSDATKKPELTWSVHGELFKSDFISESYIEPIKTEKIHEVNPSSSDLLPAGHQHHQDPQKKGMKRIFQTLNKEKGHDQDG